MLSKKYKKILKELDLNSRQPISQIAKKTKIGKETVGYAIKSMERQGIIKGYFPLVNYFRLGSNVFKILMRYKNLGDEGELKIIRWLEKKEGVIWIGKTEGKWDLVISIGGKNLEKIYKLIEEFNKKFSVNIQEKQILISYGFEWLNEKYLYEDKRENYAARLNYGGTEIKIDAIDEKIIEQLEANARVPLIDISAEIGLTAEATSMRIKNLTRKGVIERFKLRMNHEKLNKGYHHLFVSLNDFSKIDEIISYYERSRNCVFIMKYHGGYDFHLELISDSENEFRDIIKEFRERFGRFVTDYQQLTILQEFKLL